MVTSLKVFSAIYHKKRASLFTSLLGKGSLTVEASIVLPLFIFFFLNLLSAIQMIGIQSNLIGAFHQVGKEMAIQGYLYDKTPTSTGNVSWISSVALSNTHIKNKVINIVGKENVDNSLISKGSKGISFLLSEIMVDKKGKNDDIIDIVGVYQVNSHFNMIPLFSINMMNRCRVRAWTGYDNTNATIGQEDNDVEGEGKTIVYVAETGTVYHTNRNCSHISLSIQISKMNQIETLRNENGAKYYLCETCGEEEGGVNVYITDTGNRYHKTTSCQGLKRTVKQLTIDQVGTRVPCIRCQGG